MIENKKKSKKDEVTRVKMENKKVTKNNIKTWSINFIKNIS